jgi:hypothetical protein
MLFQCQALFKQPLRAPGSGGIRPLPGLSGYSPCVAVSGLRLFFNQPPRRSRTSRFAPSPSEMARGRSRSITAFNLNASDRLLGRCLIGQFVLVLVHIRSDGSERSSRSTAALPFSHDTPSRSAGALLRTDWSCSFTGHLLCARALARWTTWKRGRCSSRQGL